MTYGGQISSGTRSGGQSGGEIRTWAGRTLVCISLSFHQIGQTANGAGQAPHQSEMNSYHLLAMLFKNRSS